MQIDGHEIIKNFRPGKIILPVLIGLGVVFYLVISNFDREAYEQITWTGYTTLWIMLAVVMMCIRDIAYMYRIKVLSGNEITWRRSFPVIMLWEFSSAVTPTMIGGTALAFFILNKEKVKMGRSIAVVLTTSFLDELFFVLAVPLVFLFVGKANLFISLDSITIGTPTDAGGIYYFFWLGYYIILGYTLLVAYALFINPRAVKWLLLKLFSLPLLRRWKQGAWQTGNDMIIASGEIKHQPAMYWVKSFGATIFSWTARYMVINCIIMAFIQHGWYENMIIYARQLVMWIILLVSPTPGASGIAEVIFSRFLGEMVPAGISDSLALLWRLISYYPYLFIGAIILPRWVKKHVIDKQ
jgi:glycosyltransferase 2 family protein